MNDSISQDEGKTILTKRAVKSIGTLCLLVAMMVKVVRKMQ